MTTPVYAEKKDFEIHLQGVADLVNEPTVTNIQNLLRNASRVIDARLRRAPGAFKIETSSERTFDGNGTRSLWIGELATAPSSVKVFSFSQNDFVELTSDEFFVWPYHALDEGRPIVRIDLNFENATNVTFPRRKRGVKVTGPWGFSTEVPEEIEQATIVQAIRWFMRGQQGYEDAGAIPELSQSRFVSKLDQEVESIIAIPKFFRMMV